MPLQSTGAHEQKYKSENASTWMQQTCGSKVVLSSYATHTVDLPAVRSSPYMSSYTQPWCVDLLQSMCARQLA